MALLSACTQYPLGGGWEQPLPLVLYLFFLSPSSGWRWIKAITTLWPVMEETINTMNPPAKFSEFLKKLLHFFLVQLWSHREKEGSRRKGGVSVTATVHLVELQGSMETDRAGLWLCLSLQRWLGKASDVVPGLPY